jgi:hypothetical protein
MAHRVCSALLALALGLASWPKSALADEPIRTFTYDKSALPPPSARWSLLGYGTLVAAGSYGFALGVSYAYSDDRGAEDLRLPVVGPWIKLGQTQLCSDTSGPDCNNVYQVAGAIFIGIDGLLQAGSLALLLQGILMHTRRPEPTATLSTASYGSSRFGGGRLETGTRVASPLTFNVGNITMIPTFSSVPGADASLGWMGTF